MSQAIRKAKLLLVRNKTVEPAKPLLVQKESVEKPYETKLMICIEVLCALVSYGPMNLSRLCGRIGMGKSRLEPNLRLLWNRGLIEEEKFGGNEVHYVVTKRGLKVLNVIGPLLKEAHKIHTHDFEAVSAALSVAGYP
jgi:predicted transcriptional regulator